MSMARKTISFDAPGLVAATLRGAAERAGRRFSGIGIIVYKGSKLDYEYHADLRPNIPCPKGIRLGSAVCIDELLRISDRSNPLHDGFNLFNGKGRLTHVAQYVFFRPVRGASSHDGYGTRYMTAKYGSFDDSILMAGIVEHDRKCFMFQNGRMIPL